MPIILRSKGVLIELCILTVGTVIGTAYCVLYIKDLLSATLLRSPLSSQDTDTSHPSRKSLKSRVMSYEQGMSYSYLSSILQEVRSQTQIWSLVPNAGFVPGWSFPSNVRGAAWNLISKVKTFENCPGINNNKIMRKIDRGSEQDGFQII